MLTKITGIEAGEEVDFEMELTDNQNKWAIAQVQMTDNGGIDI